MVYETKLVPVSEKITEKLNGDMSEIHIQNAVDAKLFPEEVFAYGCYTELSKVIPKAISSGQYSRFKISDDISKLLTGNYVDEKDKSLCFKFAEKWFVLTNKYPGSFGINPIIYSNVNNLPDLKALFSLFFKADGDQWRILKTPLKIYEQRGLYHNEQYRYVTKRIHPDDFEKLVPIFKTPEATFYTDLSEVEKFSEVIGEQKGCWSFQVANGVSLYIRADSKNAVCLVMDETRIELSVEGDDVLSRGFNGWMIATLGRPLNDLERKMFGLIFNGDFIVNKTIKSETAIIDQHNDDSDDDDPGIGLGGRTE